MQVTDLVRDSGGNPQANVQVTFTLAGTNGAPIEGYDSTGSLVGIVSVVTDNTGAISVTLDPNTSITPSGSVYRVHRRVSGVTSTLYITVPSTGGPYAVKDILTTAPASLPPAGADAYGAAAAVQTNLNTTNSNVATNTSAIAAETTRAQAAEALAIVTNKSGLQTSIGPIAATTLAQTLAGGTANSAYGSGALSSPSLSGIDNTAAGAFALYANMTGNYNTAAGAFVLQANTTGSSNTAAGTSALHANTTGSSNTAAGANALQANTTGSSNTAAGMNALQANTSGNYNTAAGTSALYANMTGNYNTAAGTSALYANMTGSSNTAAGAFALYANTSGSSNTAAGTSALQANTTGNYNTAAGMNALYANTTGSSNTAAGMNAGYAPAGSTANATTTATGQTLIGYQSGQSSATQYNYATAIGYQALVGASGAIALGVDSTGQGAVSNTQDLAVIGTSLTTLQVAKLALSSQPALVAGDKYLVISAAGNIHVSSLGPAS